MLPVAQHSAHACARSIDLFSGSDAIEAAHPAGQAYVAATRMALLHREVSEAVEEIRSWETNVDRSARQPDDPLSLELADVLNRVLALAEYLGVDLGASLVAKTADTLGRYRHGGVRF